MIFTVFPAFAFGPIVDGADGSALSAPDTGFFVYIRIIETVFVFFNFYCLFRASAEAGAAGAAVALCYSEFFDP